MTDRTEYSPAFQDEYRRLWHRDADKLARIRALLADPSVTYSTTNGTYDGTSPMMVERPAIQAVLDEQ